MASRGRGSKTKGHSFERKVAKLLSSWYFGVSDRLKRTPLSGGLSLSLKGDLFEDLSVKISDDPVINAKKLFPFNVECKCSEVPLDMSALFHPKSVFWAWWKQTITEFDKTPDRGKIPLLVFSRNNIKPMVCMPSEALKNCNLIPKTFIEINGLSILPLDSFLSIPRDQFVLIDSKGNKEAMRFNFITYPKKQNG